VRSTRISVALARVAHETQDHQFAVQTSRPNVKVSWRVEGARNDRWVRMHGATTEQSKPDEYRGTYLQPELFDHPGEKAQGFHPALEHRKPAAISAATPR
jgi:hypothetical protein